MQNNTHLFDYTQPNSTPRMEMLIVIDYLQNEAYDKEHAAKQTDIVRYAKKNYGMVIRRDRISQILIHLEEISKHGPHLLPFELGVVDLKSTKKYYVPRRMFRDIEVEKIIAAIKSDNNLSDAETEALCNKFLDVTVNKAKQAHIKKKIEKRKKNVNKVSTGDYVFREAFLNAIEKKSRLVFRLKSLRSVGISDKNFITRRKVEKYISEDTYGYAYLTYTTYEKLYYVLYIPNDRIAIITKADNFVLVRTNENWNNHLSFNIDKYDSIDEWVEDYFTGKDGRVSPYKLKVTIGYKGKAEQKDFIEFKKEFKKYWKKDLKYEVVERELERDKDESDEEETEKSIVLDAVFTIESNRSSFTNWYKMVFDKVVILEPSELNDRYLREKIFRYARRLSKYGYFSNYEIVETFKPEYERDLKRLEERREEFKKKRELEKMGSNKSGK